MKYFQYFHNFDSSCRQYISGFPKKACSDFSVSGSVCVLQPGVSQRLSATVEDKTNTTADDGEKEEMC